MCLVLHRAHSRCWRQAPPQAPFPPCIHGIKVIPRSHRWGILPRCHAPLWECSSVTHKAVPEGRLPRCNAGTPSPANECTHAVIDAGHHRRAKAPMSVVTLGAGEQSCKGAATACRELVSLQGASTRVNEALQCNACLLQHRSSISAAWRCFQKLLRQSFHNPLCRRHTAPPAVAKHHSATADTM